MVLRAKEGGLLIKKIDLINNTRYFTLDNY
jgi:hypothetical protein